MNLNSKFCCYIEVALFAIQLVHASYVIPGTNHRKTIAVSQYQISAQATLTSFLFTMKTGVAFVALFAGANAFVPATSSTRTASAVAAGLEGMIGVGPETGNRIVSDHLVLF